MGSRRRSKPQMRGGAAGRLQHAGQHFQRGGFARAVWAEKTDDLPGGNFEARVHPRRFARRNAWSVDRLHKCVPDLLCRKPCRLAMKNLTRKNSNQNDSASSEESSLAASFHRLTSRRARTVFIMKSGNDVQTDVFSGWVGFGSRARSSASRRFVVRQLFFGAQHGHADDRRIGLVRFHARLDVFDDLEQQFVRGFVIQVRSAW